MVFSNENCLKQLLDTIVNNPGDKSLPKIFYELSQKASSILTRTDVIAKCIYEYTDEEVEKLKNFFREDVPLNEPSFQGLQMQLECVGNSYSLDNFGKFQVSVNLACVQREFLKNNMVSAKEIAKEANRVANEALELKTKIYSEFIAILGIFTAISFMSMGSLQMLGDLFKDVKDPTTVSIGYAMIVGGIYIVIMYVFVIIMFVGMKKVVGNGDEYDFSTEICAIALIAVATLIGAGLLICGHLISGLMFITLDIVGIIIAFLVPQKSPNNA